MLISIQCKEQVELERKLKAIRARMREIEGDYLVSNECVIYEVEYQPYEIIRRRIGRLPEDKCRELQKLQEKFMRIRKQMREAEEKCLEELKQVLRGYYWVVVNR